MQTFIEFVSLTEEEHPLDAIAKKHNIPLSASRKTAGDFDYHPGVEKDLHAAGYKAEWDGKKFKISKHKTQDELDKEKLSGDIKNSQEYKDSKRRAKSQSRSLSSDANRSRMKK